MTKIMVVEDETIISKDIQNTLTNLNYDVCGSAISGENAIKKAEEMRPDLILMDIVLKGKMDGIDAAKQISSRFNIPIVFLTAHADEETLRRAKVSEPYGYILKPFEDRELQTSIEMAIYRHKNQRLLSTIARVNEQFIINGDTRVLFERLLEEILGITGSEYGFIGEILFNEKEEPFLKTHAITNIAWNKKTKEFYDENAPTGMEFYNLDTLFGAVIKTGKPVMANDPKKDPRSGGLPRGHPPLKAFLGAPFYAGGKVVGMVGIANKVDGYGTDIVEYLHPLLVTCGNIIEAYRTEQQRIKAEEEVKTLKEFNENIVQSLQESVILTDAEGYITFANPKAQDILGYEEPLAGQHMSAFVPKDCHDLYNSKESELESGMQVKYESLLKSKEGNEINVLVNSSPQSDEDGYTGAVSSYTDITELRKKEAGVTENRLKYKVTRGKSYLIEEKGKDKALDIFNDLVSNGFEGIVISRDSPSDIKDECREDVHVFWLSQEGSVKDCIRPHFQIIEDAIRANITRNSVLLIGRLDYLIVQKGFKETVKFIQKISELMLLRKGVLLLQVDDATLTDQQKSILEKEAHPISRRVMLPEELFSVMEYIKKQNDKGNKPSFTDITQKFGITENTARKRVRRLQAQGLLEEIKYGRYKLLEVTKTGKTWF
jgi:PAS domain S-box-containing protein